MKNYKLKQYLKQKLIEVTLHSNQDSSEYLEAGDPGCEFPNGCWRDPDTGIIYPIADDGSVESPVPPAVDTDPVYWSPWAFKPNNNGQYPPWPFHRTHGVWPWGRSGPQPGLQIPVDVWDEWARWYRQQNGRWPWEAHPEVDWHWPESSEIPIEMDPEATDIA